MYKQFILYFLIILPSFSSAQNNALTDTSQWKHSVVGGLTLTQVSFSDWAAGGENAFAWTISVEGKSELDNLKANWTNNYRFAYGLTKLGNQGTRKTDDKIDVSSTYTLKLNAYVNPYFSLTFKSQFDDGENFDAAGKRTVVSKFLDPGYLTESGGAGYQPLPEIKTRLGVALRETFSKHYGYADDPTTATEIEKTHVEGGAESVTEIQWKIDDNLLLTSKLELFAPFKTLDEVVVRGDNTITAKVSKYITVNLNVLFINEKRITPRTQIKETLAMGLSYTLL